MSALPASRESPAWAVACLSGAQRGACQVRLPALPQRRMRLLLPRPVWLGYSGMCRRRDPACGAQVMVEVSRLVERRMVRRAERKAAYAAYQQRTPAWLGLAWRAGLSTAKQ